MLIGARRAVPLCAVAVLLSLLSLPAQGQSPFVSASLQNGQYGGGLTQDTMSPVHGDSPHVLGIANGAEGVTYTPTESNGRSNAVIYWQPGANRDAFRLHGTVSLWLKADHDVFTAMTAWGHILCENYGWTQFNHGQSTFSASVSQVANGPGADDDRLRLGWSTWHNNVWYYPTTGQTVDLEFGRWYNVGYSWGGAEHDYEIWVDGVRKVAYDLPAGVNLPWGLSSPPSASVVALGGVHERGMNANSYSSASGLTYRDLSMWDVVVPQGGTVPEPATFSLLLLAGLGLLRRRRG